MKSDMVYDVVIVGAGLSGGLAAFHLADSGLSVALIEKESQPHHKVCGEYLSQEGVEYLHEVGFPFEELNASSIYNFEYHSESSSIQHELPMVARGISRQITDQWLLNESQKRGAHIYTGTRVIRYQRRDDLFEVETKGKSYWGRNLFLATGKHDLGGDLKRKGIENDLVGFKMHLKLDQEQTEKLKNSIELFSFKGGYGGLSPVENGIYNFCYLLGTDTLKNHQLAGDWHLHANYLSTNNIQLSKRLQDAKPMLSKLVAIANVPYGFQRNLSKIHSDGVFFLGDQAAVIPSFTGEGMTIALTSARMAVDYVKSYGDPMEASRAYTLKMNEMVGRRMQFALPIHKLMRSSYSKFAAYGMRWIPGAVPLIFKKTRCPEPFFWRQYHC